MSRRNTMKSNILEPKFCFGGGIFRWRSANISSIGWMAISSVLYILSQIENWQRSVKLLFTRKVRSQSIALMDWGQAIKSTIKATTQKSAFERCSFGESEDLLSRIHLPLHDKIKCFAAPNREARLYKCGDVEKASPLFHQSNPLSPCLFTGRIPWLWRKSSTKTTKTTKTNPLNIHHAVRRIS